MIVTAQKREQRLQDVGQTIAVLTGQDLEKQGVRTLDQLATSVPSLVVTRTEFSAPVLSLRGVGFYENSIAGSPAVTLYVDQAPISFLAESTGVLFDLERIEVLKGPQGTLFGQNSTGGAVNLIAAKPTQSFAAGASLSYGRFDAIDGAFFISGPLTDTFSARLAGQILRGGAWQRSHSRGDDLGSRDLTSARLSFNWTPTDQFDASLVLSGWTDQSDTLAAQYVALQPFLPGAPGRPAAGDPLTNADARDADWDPDGDFSRDNSRGQVAIQANYDLTEQVRLTSITSVSGYKFRSLTDQDGAPFQNALNRQRGNTRSFFQELRVNATVDALTMVAGLNYQRDHAKEYLYQGFPDATARFVFGPAVPLEAAILSDEHEITSKAVFANVEAALGGGFTLIGGLRYTEDTRDYSYCAEAGGAAAGYAGLRDLLRSSAGLPPGPPVPPGACLPIGSAPEFEIGPVRHSSLKADNLSWRLTAQMKPDPDTLLYASVARGYKSGTYPFSAVLFVEGLKPVEQESLTDYEAGFKYSASSRLQLNGAVFYYDYRDKQIKGNIPTIFGPLLALINIPKSRVIGAEAEILAKPVEGLTVRANATWLDAEVTEDYFNIDAFSNTFNFKGQKLPLTPRWSADIDAEYRWSVTDTWNAYAGVHVNYASTSRAQFVDRRADKYDLFDLAARTLVDLRLGVENSRYRAEIWGRNITDEFYASNVYKGVDTINQLAGMPATYGLTLAVTY